MHVFTAGVTGSGKTTLQKAIAATYQKRGIGVLVCDPRSEPGWQADRVLMDAFELLDLAKRSTRCAIFFAEAAESIGRNGGPLNWFANQSRHRGHIVNFGSQRMTDVDPVIRDNCSELFCFNVRPKQADFWSSQFGDSDLELAPLLKKYEFLQKKPFERVRFMRLGSDMQSLMTVSSPSQ